MTLRMELTDGGVSPSLKRWSGGGAAAPIPKAQPVMVRGRLMRRQL
jgi:hypothetical protein